MKGLSKHIAALAVMALFILGNVEAQQLMGLVVQKNTDQVDEAVVGANVYWLGTTTSATTGKNGMFRISRVEGADQLVVSFIGLIPDTITVSTQTSVKVELKSTTHGAGRTKKYGPG
jgi:outer membrane receptor for ferrienterochelin and colicins